MKIISLPFYYNLGGKLGPLAETRADQRTKFEILIGALQARQFVAEVLNVHGITISRPQGQTLLTHLNTIIEWNLEPADMTPGEQFIASNMIAAAKAFETILSAELQSLAVYQVMQKGIYATQALIEQAENMFPDSVKSKLKPGVVEEVRQCGRCLAFDNSTASGFHILRAVEAVMHDYYLAVCAPQSQDRLANWGAYITKFRALTDHDVQEVAALLQQVKDEHRNLIMHPEVVLTPDDAAILLEIGKGTIVAMGPRLPTVAVAVP